MTSSSSTHNRRENRRRAVSSLQGMFADGDYAAARQQQQPAATSEGVVLDRLQPDNDDASAGLSRKLRRMKRRLLLEAATEGSLRDRKGAVWRQDSQQSMESYSGSYSSQD